MTGSASSTASHAPSPTDDFSLVLGGPLYQLFRRSGLLKPPLDLLRRRILVLSLLTWLPLLVLSALEDSFAVVREMRAFPFGKGTVPGLVLVLDELIRRVLGVLL